MNKSFTIWTEEWEPREYIDDSAYAIHEKCEALTWDYIRKVFLHYHNTGESKHTSIFGICRVIGELIYKHLDCEIAIIMRAKISKALGVGPYLCEIGRPGALRRSKFCQQELRVLFFDEHGWHYNVN